MTHYTRKNRSERRLSRRKEQIRTPRTRVDVEHCVPHNVTEELVVAINPTQENRKTDNKSEGNLKPSISKDHANARRAGGIAIRDAIVSDEKKFLLFQQGNASKWVAPSAFSFGDKTGLSALKAAGLNAFGAKAVRELIEDIESVEVHRSQLAVDRYGWTAPYYTLQNSDVIVPSGVEAPPVVLPSRTSRVAYRGHSHRWRKDVAGVFTGHPIGECILSAAFAGQIMNLIGWSGTLGIGLEGASSSGKSTLQLAAASSHGPATDSVGHYRHTFNSTINALDDLMPMHRDSLFVIDELGFLDTPVTATSAKSLYDFIMRFGGGDERRRLSDDIGSGVANNLVFLTSANKALAVALAPLGAANIEAATVRLSLIPVPDRPSGVWERVPEGYKSIPEAIGALHTAMSNHHGVASKRFVQRLVQDRASDATALVKKIKRYYDGFLQSVQEEADTGQDHRINRQFALVKAAGCLAKDYNVLPRSFDPDASARTCLNLVKCKNRLVSNDPSIQDRLVNWLRANTFFDLRVERAPQLSNKEFEKRGAFVAFGVKKRIEVQLSRGVLHQIFPDYSRILSSDEARGMMISVKNSYQTRREVRDGHLAEAVYCFILPEGII